MKQRLADGADASSGLRDVRHRGHGNEDRILSVPWLVSSTWWPARLSCIAGGEEILSIRTRQPAIKLSLRSSSHPEHIAHTSELLLYIPARPQLDGPWLVQRSPDVPRLSVGSRLAFSAPSGSANDPGLSGHLCAAKRTCLSQDFARFGRRSERQRALDDVCACRSCGDAAPLALECVHRSRPMLRWCAQAGQAS